MRHVEQLRFGCDGGEYVLRATGAHATARRLHLTRVLLAAMGGLLIGPALAGAGPIKVVAAESVYGDIASQIGGADVSVQSIIKSPSQDPHEFEPGVSTARAMADADVVIYNGVGYDAWAANLLRASGSAGRQFIDVAMLAHKKSGDNPHLWYEPAAVSALGEAVAAKLTHLRPEQGPEYARGLASFAMAMQRLQQRIAVLRARYAGTVVTATEPVFDYMADALGLIMRNDRFQLAVMNGTEPGASAIAAFEHDLRSHAVKVLLYNRQTSQALAERMRRIAEEAGVPVVAISETEPLGVNYQAWMLDQLDALDRALGGR
jgi:zinc/manganese transport system substrate-binding protein